MQQRHAAAGQCQINYIGRLHNTSPVIHDIIYLLGAALAMHWQFPFKLNEALTVAVGLYVEDWREPL